MNINDWANQYGIEHQFVATNPLQIESRVGEFRADNGSLFQYGTFENNGQPESIDDWNIIETIGDGSCLIHSFLLLLSEYYRTVSTKDKKELARAFRLYIADNPIFSEEESRLIRTLGQGEKNDAWLNDMIAEKLARWLGYGLIMLCFYQTQYDSPEPQIMSTDDNLPYLIIGNTGGVIQEGLMGSGLHFLAIKRLGLYVSPPNIGPGIEIKKIQLIDATMTRLTNVSDGPPLERNGLDRCDSPRKRRSLVNSISIKEARRRAKDFGVDKATDDKEKLCRKLHVLNNVNWFHKNIYQRNVSGKKRRTKPSKKRNTKCRTKLRNTNDAHKITLGFSKKSRSKNI